MNVGETYFGIHDCTEKERKVQSMKKEKKQVKAKYITALYCRLSKEDDLITENNSITYQKD